MRDDDDDDEGSRYFGYNGKAAIGLGIVQMILGMGCITVGVICIFQLTSFGFIGHGIWSGVMFLVSGSVATAAGSRSTDPMVMAGTVLSVISVLFSLAPMALSALGLYSDITQVFCNGTTDVCAVDPFLYCSIWIEEPQCLDMNGNLVSIILASVLAFLALFEFAFGLATACLVCSCCSVKQNKVNPSSDDLRKNAASPVQPVFVHGPPPSRMSNLYEFEDAKSSRVGPSRVGVPQEFRLSYAN